MLVWWRGSENMCVVPIMDCWHFIGGMYQNDSLVSACGTMCSKESVILDLNAFFDCFRHQDMRSNGLEQSESNIKGVGTVHTWILCFVASMHKIVYASSPTRAGIKLKHLQCIHMTVNDSVLQWYTWRKSGVDGVMYRQCAIAVVVMCMVAALRKRRRLKVHFSVAVVGGLVHRQWQKLPIQELILLLGFINCICNYDEWQHHVLAVLWLPPTISHTIDWHLATN